MLYILKILWIIFKICIINILWCNNLLHCVIYLRYYNKNLLSNIFKILWYHTWLYNTFKIYNTLLSSSNRICSTYLFSYSLEIYKYMFSLQKVQWSRDYFSFIYSPISLTYLCKCNPLLWKSSYYSVIIKDDNGSVIHR